MLLLLGNFVCAFFLCFWLGFWWVGAHGTEDGRKIGFGMLLGIGLAVVNGAIIYAFTALSASAS